MKNIELNTTRELIMGKFTTQESGKVCGLVKNFQPEPLHCLPKDGLTRDVPENIMRMMEGPGIHRGRKSDYSEVRQSLIEDIRKYVKAEQPVNFVFIALPFKNPDPMSTVRMYPDMGELMMIKHLLSINETIKLVYTPGLKFTVLCETFDYVNRGVFQTDSQRALNYKQGLDKLIKFYNAANIIKLIDLEELTENYSKFDRLMNERSQELAEMELTGDLAKLAHGIMRLSLDTVNIATDLGVDIEDLPVLLHKVDMGIVEGNKMAIALSEKITTWQKNKRFDIKLIMILGRNLG